MSAYELCGGPAHDTKASIVVHSRRIWVGLYCLISVLAFSFLATAEYRIGLALVAEIRISAGYNRVTGLHGGRSVPGSSS
jgi:hypothetical protein